MVRSAHTIDKGTHLVGQILWLSKKSREFESFSDSSLRQVDIDLLTVSSRSLERDRERVSIHENFTFNLSIGLSGGKDVHQSGLSGTGGTHHGGQCTGFTVSKDVVEQLSRLFIGLHNVV
jgi:hypothetical protein